MSQVKLGALIAVAIGLSLTGLAHAQTDRLSPFKGLWTRPDYDQIYAADRVDEETRRELAGLHKTAIEALEAKNYAAAETTLNELVRHDSTTTDANFLMGLAKIGLNKWGEARTYLEVAVQKEPTRPEPKTRLGLSYIMLNNFDGARKLRADLAGLDGDCKRTCPDATWIADGLVLLDQALAPGAQAAVLPAPAPESAVASTSAFTMAKDFDPKKYSLVTFDDANDLYNLLTQDGRCAPKKLAEPRQPCALILYRPDDKTAGGLAANFKPVFSVISPTSIWAVHDKTLQKVKIDALYFDEENIIGEKKTGYRSVAVIGNAENKANCDKSLPCLSNLVVQDMFRMYGNMPDSVVEVIWGAGVKDPGTVRIR